jgi:hypothetical protein
MNKIKYLVMAFVAVCLTAAISSCEKEKEVEKIVEKEVIKTDTVTVEKKDTVREPASNWERYQQLVTADVKNKKKQNKAILLVAFGSTWEQAFNAFDTTIDA